MNDSPDIETGLSLTINTEKLEKTVGELTKDLPFLWELRWFRLLELLEQPAYTALEKASVFTSQIWFRDLSETDALTLRQAFSETVDPFGTGLLGVARRFYLELSALTKPPKLIEESNAVGLSCEGLCPVKYLTCLAPDSEYRTAYGFTTSRTFLLQGRQVNFRPQMRRPWHGPDKPPRPLSNDETILLSSAYERVDPWEGEGGFPWTVPKYTISIEGNDLGIRQNLIDDGDRGFLRDTSALDIPSSYVQDLVDQQEQTWTNLAVRRVLIRAWMPLLRCPAQIVPVYERFQMAPIFLPEWPSEFVLYADASGCTLDITGARLVEDDHWREWLDEQKAFLKKSIERYLTVSEGDSLRGWRSEEPGPNLRTRIDKNLASEYSGTKFFHKIFFEAGMRRRNIKAIRASLDGL